jgi:hypothetical protein
VVTAFTYDSDIVGFSYRRYTIRFHPRDTQTPWHIVTHRDAGAVGAARSIAEALGIVDWFEASRF